MTHAFPTRGSSDLPARVLGSCRRTSGTAVPPLCIASVCSWFAFLLSCCGGVFLRQPAGLAQRVAQHVLDLRVEAAQLIVGPELPGGEHLDVAASRVGPIPAHGRFRSLGLATSGIGNE